VDVGGFKPQNVSKLHFETRLFEKKRSPVLILHWRFADVGGWKKQNVSCLHFQNKVDCGLRTFLQL